MIRPLCIYHNNCADGFAAAWVVWKFFNGEVDFHGGVHNTPPPDVTDRHVIMVDFSYKRPVIEEMKTGSRSMLILDHHKSAFEDLTGYPTALNSWYTHVQDVTGLIDDIKVVEQYAANEPRVLFDMERSGAGITWDFFFPTEDRPPLLNRVEDRDLWRFVYDNSENVLANLFSYPQDFEVWNTLMHMDEEGLDDFAKDGETIQRKQTKDILEFIKIGKRRMVIGDFDVPVLNVPYIWSSEAGNIMAENEAFAACYWDTKERREFSLRSKENGADVQAVATKYGGGGHKHAAGFDMPIGWEGEVKGWKNGIHFEKD